MAKKIRLTVTPGVETTVSDREYEDLLALGLVVGQAQPAPPDPDDVEVANLLDDETSLTYARMQAQLAAVVRSGAGALPDALRAAYGAQHGRVPQLAGLDFALRNGLSAAFGWHGDSTGDSDGTNPADLRTPTRLAQLIAAKYPAVHVLSRTWNPATETFGPPVVLRAAPGGQAYTNFGLRSVRAPSALFTSGSLDVRARVRGSVTAAEQTIAAQLVGDGVPYATAFVFRFLIRADGTLRLGVSYDGAGLDSFDSTAPLPATFTDVWLRATCAITPGATGSIAVTFYTSTDGTTWTQLGAVLGPYVGPRSALHATTASHFEVGAEGWQPAGNSFTGRIYEVEIRDGIDGPLLAPALPSLWERYADPATTYGGAPTLYLINGSRSGADLAYHRDPARLRKMTPDYGQVVAYFNVSHNMVGASGPVQWLEPYRQWVTAVQGRLPAAAAVAVGQNPHTPAWANEAAYGVSHVKRIAELSTFAGRQGWGYLDLYSAFRADPRGLDVLIEPEGLHPTQAGYALAADTAAAALGLR